MKPASRKARKKGLSRGTASKNLEKPGIFHLIPFTTPCPSLMIDIESEALIHGETAPIYLINGDKTRAYRLGRVPC